MCIWNRSGIPGFAPYLACLTWALKHYFYFSSATNPQLSWWVFGFQQSKFLLLSASAKSLWYHWVRKFLRNENQTTRAKPKHSSSPKTGFAFLICEFAWWPARGEFSSSSRVSLCCVEICFPRFPTSDNLHFILFFVFHRCWHLTAAGNLSAGECSGSLFPASWCSSAPSDV